MAYYRIVPGAAVFLHAVPVAIAFFLAAGLGLWLSALNVEYRDFRVVVPFLLQIWTYATPVAYPLSVLPPRFQRILAWNPMTGVVETFRACAFRLPIPWAMLGTSALETLVIAVSGAYFFRRVERRFADVI